jgi:hypothetical protein
MKQNNEDKIGWAILIELPIKESRNKPYSINQKEEDSGKDGTSMWSQNRFYGTYHEVKKVKNFEQNITGSIK